MKSIPLNHKGSHYVALYFNGIDFIYFDPFGLECWNKYIIDFIKEKNHHLLYYSNVQIQGIFSLFCGYYCLSFLLAMNEGKSISEFQRMFSSHDFKMNEYICVNYIKERIGKIM